jgi:predicted amidohydrolase YtcJ
MLIAVIGGCAEGEREETATTVPSLIVHNATVWTGDPDQPWAQAIAVAGSRIVSVGSNDQILALFHSNDQLADIRRIDARGALVVPGFIDTHVHYLDGGFALSSVQLRDAATPDEFVRRIGDFARTVPAGTWITAGDWDHELWGGELPTRDWIDALTPEHPVWVNRLDGHMNLANSKALELAGVDESIADIEGGEITRDSSGRLTGILKDNAQALVNRVLPPPAPELEDAAFAAAAAHMLSNGVTSVHAMGTWRELEVFRRARQRGESALRIYSCVPLDTWQRLADEVEAHGRGDEWLKIGCLKGFVDGSLGSHTAAFLEPFSDGAITGRPDDRGFFVSSDEDRQAATEAATRAGLQVNVHAIGDLAIRSQLDIFEAAWELNEDPRFRIEHAQHIHPDDLARFAEIGVIASMQPYHAIDDGRWAERVIGEQRSRTTYAFRSLLDAGALVAFGSDWTVAPATPIEGLYAAVTRRTLDGRHPEGWFPEQKIELEEALRAYTGTAAYASFEEQIKGSLESGKLADIVVLDSNLFELDPPQLKDARVVYTIVGGEVVFEAER